MEPKIYITYDLIFDDDPHEIHQYLKSVPRDNLIKFALLLIQSRGKYEYLGDYISAFFCRENESFIEKVLKGIGKHISKDKIKPQDIIPKSYFIVSEKTGLELLRQAYSISIESFETTQTQVIQEQNLFKAILLINQKISKIDVKEEYTEKGELTELYFARSLFCTFLNNYESNNLDPEYLILLQVIKGYYFFKYCESSKLKEHLKMFLERNGLSSWEQYLYNAIKLLLFPFKNEEGYSMILLNEDGDGYSFLHSHAFNKDSVIALEENHDYTYFKSHPLIEVDSHTFIPINTLFCVNHLYRSIYFEFRNINRLLKDTEYYIKGSGLRTIFTTEFSEQYLFDTFMRIILKRRHGVKLSDSDCKEIANIGHEPDFYYRDGNNILLFENKDVLIADYIISSGDYNEIEKVLNQKLVNEAGISQLLYNIKAIDSNKFVWDKSIPKKPRVYPILVLDDSTLCVPGLNFILNTAFERKLKELNIGIKVFPLVVIEMDTLIAFAKDFETGNYKMKDVIDKFCVYQNRQPRRVEPNKILREVFQKYFPFYHFFTTEFAHKPFDYSLFEEICDALRRATEG